jgi:hypothetical protein
MCTTVYSIVRTLQPGIVTRFAGHWFRLSQEMKIVNKFFLTTLGLCALGISSWVAVVAQEPAQAKQGQPAVERAKKQAKMLDTLYKSAIVLITENYVTGKESMAAGDAFQALFQSMKDNGFHEVRLLDATGDAYDTDNEPKTEFEKKAVKALLDGKPIYEEVVTEKGKRFLLSATPIPVVMQKCVLCHAHYEGVQGPIGALGLKIPVE